MPTIHEINSFKEGEEFISVGPIVVTKQLSPKVAKNGRLYCTAFIKNGSSDASIFFWDDSAAWKLPLDTPITLRGKFFKNEYQGKLSIRCDELSKPEGAEQFDKKDIQVSKGKPSIKECIDAGLRAADYCVRKNAPDCASAAFAFAAQAMLDGHSME